MSRQKYKITGFAKFMIFMVLFMPIAYLGMTTIKGENPKVYLRSFKEKLKGLKETALQDNGSNEELLKTISKKDEEIQQLREDLFKCEQASSSSAGN